MDELQRALKKHQAEIRMVTGILAERGWAESNGGNFSLRLEDDYNPSGKNHKLASSYPSLSESSFLVTLKGSRMRDIAQDPGNNLGLVKIDVNGTSYFLLVKKGSVTSEFSAHLSAHRALRENRPSLRVFLHTHPTHLIALTHKIYDTSELIRLLPRMFPEAAILLYDNLSSLPYLTPGSDELAAKTAQALKGNNGVIWARHGMAVAAENLSAALDFVETAEKAAEVALLLGDEVSDLGLTQGEVERLYRIFVAK